MIVEGIQAKARKVKWDKDSGITTVHTDNPMYPVLELRQDEIFSGKRVGIVTHYHKTFPSGATSCGWFFREEKKQ